MIFGATGAGGSGKSATAINYLLENIHKYQIIATNIYSFDQEKIKNATGAHHVKFIIFGHKKEDFIQHLRYLDRLNNEDLPEEQRINSLTIYDECHKGLRGFSNSNPDEVFITDFLSEHRHKGPADFILLTQNHKKMHYMYKGDIHFWYQAVQNEKKINPNNLTFKKYDSDLKDDLKDNISISKNYIYKGKDGVDYKLFDFYVSGDAGRSASNEKFLIYRYIKYLVIFAIVIIIGIVYSISQFRDTFISEDKSEESVSSFQSYNTTQSGSSQSIQSGSSRIVNKISPYSYFSNPDRFTVTSDYLTLKFFYFKGFYTYKNYKLSQGQFEEFLQLYDLKPYKKQYVTKDLTSHYLYIHVHKDINKLFNFKKQTQKERKEVKRSTL